MSASTISLPELDKQLVEHAISFASVRKNAHVNEDIGIYRSLHASSRNLMQIMQEAERASAEDMAEMTEDLKTRIQNIELYGNKLRKILSESRLASVAEIAIF